MQRLLLALVAYMLATALAVAQTPVVSCAQGISSASTVCNYTPVATASAANNIVLKASPGALMTAYATNLTATGGFLVLLNATAAPSDGAIAPLDCVPLPANNSAGSCGPGCTGVNYRPGPGRIYSAGIVAVVTSANTCYTKTTGTITAFITGDIQ